MPVGGDRNVLPARVVVIVSRPASVAFAFLALAAWPPDGPDGPDAPDAPDAPDGPDRPGMQFLLNALVLFSAANLFAQRCHSKVRLLTCTECFGDARARHLR